MAVAEAAFMAAYPTYAGTQKLDILRAEDYSRLDRLNHIYLDYTGGGLYADSQLSQHMELMRANVFGNPHSNNPSSAAMTDLVERARHHILAYFNADPEEYTAIFTANASAALKLVGESYPFQEGGHFALTFDNHNSVNGIREFARAKGAQVTYVPSELPNLNLDRRALTRALEGANPEAANLFAFPAQSNFSGVKHPLSLIDQAQEAGWDVLLDAAAFVPSSRLDLSIWKPDFVSLSFYKIFGYPTGVGCLLARTSSLAKLVRPWFAGGTITLASVQGMKHAFGAHEIRFEDGTVNYLNIAGVEIGLKHIAAIGIDVIAERVRCLTGWLLDNLMALEHSNGRPMVRLYGTTELDERGGTLAINFYDPDGRLLDYHRVEELANERLISIRTGCFCNPGTSEIAEELTEQEVQAGFNTGNHPALPAFVEMLGELAGKSSGAVRVSVGLASNFADAHRFMDFAQSFRDQTSEKVGVVSFDIETCRFIREGP
jgi:selenocysteine lyase/cysteine desulfurase